MYEAGSTRSDSSSFVLSVDLPRRFSFLLSSWNSSVVNSMFSPDLYLGWIDDSPFDIFLQLILFSYRSSSYAFGNLRLLGQAFPYPTWQSFPECRHMGLASCLWHWRLMLGSILPLARRLSPESQIRSGFSHSGYHLNFVRLNVDDSFDSIHNQEVHLLLENRYVWNSESRVLDHISLETSWSDVVQERALLAVRD